MRSRYTKSKHYTDILVKKCVYSGNETSLTEYVDAEIR